jgi:hypothetical protein
LIGIILKRQTMKIAKEMAVEEILSDNPWMAGVLIELGYPFGCCGEIFWGTLEELVKSNGGNPDDVVVRLNGQSKPDQKE